MYINRAIFLDRDGTLIPDVPYNADPDLICLSSSMIKGLKSLTNAGFKLLLVSNQSGIALGRFSLLQLQMMERRLALLLQAQGITIDGYYYGPHHPDALLAEYRKQCSCRKPSPGLLINAAKKHRINLSESWMIGDILDDVEAGNAAGCKTILIDNGNETEWLSGPNRSPDYLAPNINTAAEQILQDSVTNAKLLTNLQ
jgi:D-glycero-D-manno-heptose 1,7-bisphosphate phosphatase